jgi:hypothetical protein
LGDDFLFVTRTHSINTIRLVAPLSLMHTRLMHVAYAYLAFGCFHFISRATTYFCNDERYVFVNSVVIFRGSGLDVVLDLLMHALMCVGYVIICIIEKIE